MDERFPELRLADLAPEQRAALSETTSEAVWIPRPGAHPDVRLTRLDNWHLTAGRGGVPLICGTVLQLDGSLRRIAAVPVLLGGRLAWTPIGWLELATSPAATETARQVATLDQATRWCATLRRALLEV